MPIKVKDLLASKKEKNAILKAVEFLRDNPNMAYSITELNEMIGINKKGQGLGRKIREFIDMLNVFKINIPLYLVRYDSKIYVYCNGEKMERKIHGPLNASPSMKKVLPEQEFYKHMQRTYAENKKKRRRGRPRRDGT